MPCRCWARAAAWPAGMPTASSCATAADAPTAIRAAGVRRPASRPPAHGAALAPGCRPPAARRHVAGHHRAGADERLLADLDAGQQHGAAADPGAAADRGALDQRVARLRAAHEVVVGGDHAGGDEHVVLEQAVRGDVGVDWILAKSPMTVSFSTQTPRPITHLAPIVAALADAGQVADDAALAQRRAGRQHRAGADRAAAAEHQRRAAARGGRWTSGQRSAACRARRCRRSDALADHGALVDTTLAPTRRPRRADAVVEHQPAPAAVVQLTGRSAVPRAAPPCVQRALHRLQHLDHGQRPRRPSRVAAAATSRPRRPGTRSAAAPRAGSRGMVMSPECGW